MRWSVLQTFSGASDGGYEAGAEPRDLPLALRHLTWQGFTWYNPRYEQRVVAAGRVALRRAQLFRDYVFVDVATRWRALNSTCGVAGLLMWEPEKPAVVPPGFVDNLRAREDDRGLVVMSKSRFKLGQKVQVKSGPMAWEKATYDGQRSRDRVMVLMTILGSEQRVEVSEDNLVAA